MSVSRVYCGVIFSLVLRASHFNERRPHLRRMLAKSSSLSLPSWLGHLALLAHLAVVTPLALLPPHLPHPRVYQYQSLMRTRFNKKTKTTTTTTTQDTYVWLSGGGVQEDVLVRVSCRMLSNGATVHVVLSDQTPCPPLRIENRSSTQTLAYRLGGDVESTVRVLEPMRWNALHWINDDKRCERVCRFGFFSSPFLFWCYCGTSFFSGICVSGC